MSVTPWQIYWLTRLDEMRVAIGFLMCLSCIACVIWGVSYYADDKEKSKPRFRLCLILFLITGAIRLATPSAKEMAAIIVLPRIANSQAVDDIGKATVELAKQWLEELKPKKDK